MNRLFCLSGARKQRAAMSCCASLRDSFQSDQGRVMKSIKALRIGFAVIAMAVFGFAQGAASGDLHVTVKDPVGKMVTDATVTVIDQAKGVARSTTQNSDGEYRFLAL